MSGFKFDIKSSLKKYRDNNPNKAHICIAELESKHNVFIITQNVDDLHEQAGSKNVHHFHGCMKEWINLDTNVKVDFDDIDDFSKYRPNVVLFGEVPHGNFEEILNKIKIADYFIVVGTSMLVQPASSLYRLVHNRCKKVYIGTKIYNPVVNLENFHEIYLKDASIFLEEYLKNL